MAIDKKFRDFGMVAIHDTLPEAFLVYESIQSYVQISCSRPIVSASWQGDRIKLEMDNGDIRAYYGLGSSDYDIVRYGRR